MALARGNRLLPILSGIVLLMALFVGLKSCSDNERDWPSLLDKVPKAPAPDADTPAETIRTLTARVADMTAQMEALRKENASLRRRDQDLRQSLKQEVLKEVEAQQSRQPPSVDSGVIASLQENLDALSTRVTDLGRQTNRAKVSTLPDRLPIGQGLLATKKPDAQGFVWTEPFDVLPSGESGITTGGLLPNRSASIPALAGPDADTSAVSAASSVVSPAEPIPYYTVPANATLIGSTGMTALIGRIPVDGQVQDPMPFKLIVGRDNLAANGITIPHIDGMIWSGTAVGDWNLSCVTGRLESVTFVFRDGTIRTLENPSDDKKLGWISDDQGIPCVSGQRITNAPAYLTNRIGVGALESAADGVAAAQTTTRVSESGTSLRDVTGNVGRYVAGKTLAGGASELRRWLEQRQDQSFDAVFVAPGARLAIHVAQELRIDYDPVGRKVRHEISQFGTLHRTHLD